MEATVKALTEEVESFQTKQDETAAVKKCLKSVAGVNEEHMKLLFKLDALETHVGINHHSKLADYY